MFEREERRTISEIRSEILNKGLSENLQSEKNCTNLIELTESEN